MSALGTNRLRLFVHKHFRCWWLTGSVPAVPVLLNLTRFGHRAAFFEEGCGFFSLTDSVCGTPRTKEFDFGPLRLELVRQAA